MEEIVIEPGGAMSRYWQDVWNYRHLFYFLAWRDLTVRYKQTVIGVAWAVIQPLLTMVIFVVVFNRLAHLESPGAPYPILVFSALLPWTFFTSALTQAANSMVTNANMVSKIYFPRIVLPAGSVIVALADFVISFCLLLILMLIFHFAPSIRMLTLPFFLLLAAFAALGPGLWMASLNVKYRDFRIVIPFVIQIGTYVSPVGFSSSIVPDQYRLLYSLNPMVGVIDGFRWAILGGETPLSPLYLGVSMLSAAIFFITGFRYFRKTERGFADVI